MTIPSAFLDELRSRTPIREIIGANVRLSRSGRHYKGCCPFHGEKTPSFYVYDDHFHCFGCGAHGDAVAYLMQAGGRSFREAVVELAGRAGLSVPADSPQAAQAARRRVDLYQVLDLAVAAFRRRLFLPDGAQGLAYLEQRGLTRATIAEWGLGWSGPGRGALLADLAREGVTADQLVEVGLMQRQDDGRVTDLFFNRVMFPIRDARGQVVSFGGRVLGDARPKYVNGPETEVFHKRRTLYGLHAARAARPDSLLVVEGYTDVLALHQAGFPGAVAPLGTALTDDHLDLLWRVSSAPVLCFDGDDAGRRAAARALQMALPKIGIDRGLSFLHLPAGEDPDSVICTAGADYMRGLIAAARPLSDAAYGLLRHPGGEPTAEARAALRARLSDAAAAVTDRNLSAELRTAWLARFLGGEVGPRGQERVGGSDVAGRLWARCQADWAPACEAARARLAQALGWDDPADLRPLVAAAPVVERDGAFELLTDRRAQKRDWRLLVAVRDGAANPDWSPAGLYDTARRAVLEGPILDVVACDPDGLSVTSRLLGATAVLGWPQGPELLDGTARLHETPRAWLADGADGAVLVGDDAQVGDWLLRCQHGVSTGNVLFGQAVRAKMRRAGVRRPWVGIRQRVAA